MAWITDGRQSASQPQTYPGAVVPVDAVGNGAFHRGPVGLTFHPETGPVTGRFMHLVTGRLAICPAVAGLQRLNGASDVMASGWLAIDLAGLGIPIR